MTCKLKRSLLCKRLFPALLIFIIVVLLFLYYSSSICDFTLNVPDRVELKALQSRSNGHEFINTRLRSDNKNNEQSILQVAQLTNYSIAGTTDMMHDLEAANAAEVLLPGKAANFWSLSASERVELQQKQVEKFCQLYMFDVKYKLPRSRYQDLVLSRHLLVDDHTKTLFCFAPKVGCTNLKLALFYAQGLLTKEDFTKTRDNIDQDKLEECIVLSSFLSRNKPERIEILKRNFKFIMYRNPLERLLSAYRSKIERYPLVGLKKDTPHYNWLRRRIFAHIRPSQYKDWLLHGGRPEVNISFSDFIDYWLTYDLSSDEHFRTIFSLCEPCRVHYNYYGNFETFDKDASVLLNRIGGHSGLLRDGYYEDHGSIPTKQLLRQYYEELNLYQKLAVIRKLALDIDFYYHVFPTEEDTHKHMLGIGYDIPRPYYL